MHIRRLSLSLLAFSSACSLQNVATEWNGRVGPEGHPVYVQRLTNIGFNLGIALPFVGKTTIEEMVDVSTKIIADNESDHVRVIETTAENYWYGFPPFTWIFTPVITTVAVEYRPSPKEVAEVEEARKRRAERARRRREQDHDDVVPDGRHR